MSDTFDTQLRSLASALTEEAPPPPQFPERGTTISRPRRPARRVAALAAAATVVLAIAGSIVVFLLRDDPATRPTPPASTPTTAAPSPRTFLGNDVPGDLYNAQLGGIDFEVAREYRAVVHAQRVGDQICIQLRSAGTDQGPRLCGIPAGPTWSTSVYAAVVSLDGQRFLIGAASDAAAEVWLGEPSEEPLVTSSPLPFPILKIVAAPVATAGPVQFGTRGADGANLNRVKITVLANGECFVADGSEVDCASPHTREDFANVFLSPPVGSAPSDLRPSAFIRSVCELLFDEYAGAPVDNQDRYSVISSGTPSDNQCSITSMGGAAEPTTGSARRALG